MGTVRSLGHDPACSGFFGKRCDCSVQRVAELEAMLGPARERPLILLDVDGVLADFVGAFLSFVYHATAQRFTREQVTDYNIVKSLGLPGRLFKDFAESLDSDPEHRTIPKLDRADEGLKMLRARGDVRFATAPLGSCRTWTHGRDAWLARHFGVPSEHVFHLHEKQHLRADYFIDDKPENVELWQAANPGGVALLFDQPWNRSSKLPRLLGWPMGAGLADTRGAA